MSTAGIKAKIAALRAKTRAAGCTEAEALAAAELAAKLMREHGIPDDDMAEASSPERTVRDTWRDVLSGVIATCTNTSSIALAGDRVVYVGRAPGPEIAVYLREVLMRAIKGEISTFKGGRFYRRRRSLQTKRAATRDFTDALVARLIARLREMFRSTMRRDLLLESKAARDARYPGGIEVTLADREARFHEAAIAGHQAGSRVPLNHGVSSSSPAPAKPVRAPAPKLPAPPRQGSLF